MRKPARRRLHRHRVRDRRRKAGLGPSVAPAGAAHDSIGHGVPANQSRCVSFFRASGKRDAQHPTAAALVRRGLQTSPSGGEPGETLSGTPKGRLPTPGGRARKRDAGAWRYPCARRGTTFPKLP